MPQTVKCLKCSSVFVVTDTVPGNLVACSHCGATQVVRESAAPLSVRRPLTDDDVLAFLGAAPKKKPTPNS